MFFRGTCIAKFCEISEFHYIIGSGSDCRVFSVAQQETQEAPTKKQRVDQAPSAPGISRSGARNVDTNYGWTNLKYIQVVPGRAGGGSFRRKKNYIAKKEFAYRMCDRPARCPNHFFAVNEPSAVPWWWCDLFWCMSCHLMWWSCHVLRCDCLCCVMSRDAMRCHVMCAHVMCPAMVTLCVRSGSVTMWWSKVLFCTTVYYKVLLQYYSVLHSTTTYYSSTTLYYSSTTLYCKVLLQYYSVLHSTTTYYSSTTLYYKVLLQYYSVLRSTTVLLCTAKYYSSTTLYYTVLQRTTPVLPCTTKYYSSTTLYCNVLLQYYSVLQSTTLYYTTTYYSSTTLYYKVLLQYYPVLQSTTPVLLCTTKYYSSTTLYYTVLQRTTPVPLCTTKYYSSTTLLLQSATPGLLCTTQYCSSTTLYYNARSNRSHPPTSPNTAPATQNDCDDWSASHMKRHLQCAEQQESQSNFTKDCACHAKWISWLIRLTYETSFRMRGASKVNLEPHQILRLPRKMNLMIDPRHIWNIIEQAKSTSNLTKYCACHEIFTFKIALETLWIASANRKTIRRHSEDTWRIIPVSKWLVTPIYKPFRPFIRGIPPFRGLTNHGY